MYYPPSYIHFLCMIIAQSNANVNRFYAIFWKFGGDRRGKRKRDEVSRRIS